MVVNVADTFKASSSILRSNSTFIAKAFYKLHFIQSVILHFEIRSALNENAYSLMFPVRIELNFYVMVLLMS